MNQGYYVSPVIDTYTNQLIRPDFIHLHIHVPVHPADISQLPNTPSGPQNQPSIPTFNHDSRDLVNPIIRPVIPSNSNQPTRYVPPSDPRIRLQLWNNINEKCIQEPANFSNPDIFKHLTQNDCLKNMNGNGTGNGTGTQPGTTAINPSSVSSDYIQWWGCINQKCQQPADSTKYDPAIYIYTSKSQCQQDCSSQIGWRCINGQVYPGIGSLFEHISQAQAQAKCVASVQQTGVSVVGAEV